MTVVFVWDGIVLIGLESGAWKRGEYTRLDEAANLLRDNLPRGARLRLVYDPETLMTEIEDVPKGSRRVVGMALADRHAAVTSETQSWGFQSQWLMPGRGTYATFLHTETGSGLFALRDRLERDLGATIEGAWPLATCAFQARPERGRAVLSVVHDVQSGNLYLGGFQKSGERISLKVKQPEPLRLWTDVREVARSAGVNLGDEGEVGARLTLYSTGTKELLGQACPYWEALTRENDLSVLNLDELAALVRKLPCGHPSNLLKALPGEFEIDGILKCLTAVAAILVLLIGIVYGGRVIRLQSAAHALEAEHGSLERQQKRHLANKEEITNLRLLYGTDVGWVSPGRAEFLRALASAVPPTASATELKLDDTGGFRLTGCFWHFSEKDSARGLVAPIEQALKSNLAAVVIAADRSAFEQKTGRFSISGLIDKE